MEILLLFPPGYNRGWLVEAVEIICKPMLYIYIISLRWQNKHAMVAKVCEV